ncbi:M56 family metallopeptidase [candidate division KSB1 bacterium]
MNLLQYLIPSIDTGSAVFQAFIDTALKGFILLSVISVLCILLRRSTAAVRHLLWGITFFGILVMPLFSVMLPEWDLHVLPQENPPVNYQRAAIDPTSSLNTNNSRQQTAIPKEQIQQYNANTSTFMGSGSESAEKMSTASMLMIFWLAGVSVIFTRFITGFAGAYYITRKAKPVKDDTLLDLSESISDRIGLNKHFLFLISSKISVPMSLGLFRPVILLPDSALSWPDDRKESVLTHELAHLKRNDYIFNIISFISLAMHWFNPIVWYAYKRISLEREKACDDFVIETGVRSSEYANHLLAVLKALRSKKWQPCAGIASMARWPELEGRVRSILDPRSNRRALKPLVSAGIILLITFLILPLSAMQPVTKEIPAAEREKSAKPINIPLFSTNKQPDDNEGIEEKFDYKTLDNFELAVQDKNEISGEYAIWIDGQALLITVFIKDNNPWIKAVEIKGAILEETQLISIVNIPLGFTVENENGYITFVKNADGKVSGCRITDTSEGETTYTGIKFTQEIKELYSDIEGYYGDSNRTIIITHTNGILTFLPAEDVGIAQVLQPDLDDPLNFTNNNFSSITFHQDEADKITSFLLLEPDEKKVSSYVKQQIESINWNDKEQVNQLFSEVSGEYTANFRGMNETVILYTKNRELWGSLRSGEDARRLIPLKGKLLNCTVDGENYIIHGMRDENGIFTKYVLTDMETGQTFSGSRVSDINLLDPAERRELKDLYDRIAGDYFAESELQIFSVYVVGDELWGSPKDVNDPRRLILTSKESIRFIVEGEPVTVEFRKDRNGDFTDCRTIDNSTGQTITAEKLSIDPDDPEKQKELEVLYEEISGDYFVESQMQTFNVYVRDGQLWGTPKGENDPRKLLLISAEQLKFIAQGEPMYFEFFRNDKGMIDRARAFNKDTGETLTAVKVNKL